MRVWQFSDSLSVSQSDAGSAGSIVTPLRADPTSHTTGLALLAFYSIHHSTAGADVVGTNCYFDPSTTLQTLALMKEGLIKAGLLDKPTYLMAQPVGFHAPDATTKLGYLIYEPWL